MMNTSLLALSITYPVKPLTSRDTTILLINSIIYAFTWFAYAAFDPVLVGLAFLIFLMVISLMFLWKVTNNYRNYPYIFYSAVAYSLATIATMIVRFR